MKPNEHDQNAIELKTEIINRIKEYFLNNPYLDTSYARVIKFALAAAITEILLMCVRDDKEKYIYIREADDINVIAKMMLDKMLEDKVH